MITSFSSSNVAGKGGRGASSGTRALWLGLGSVMLPALVTAAPLGPAVTQPDRETVVFEIDTAGPGSVNCLEDFNGQSASLNSAMTAGETAKLVRGYIDQSRASGSPRPLGLAQGVLDRIPESRWTPDLYLLRATLRQRLHQFEPARADLERVLAAEPGNGQAWLTLYSIAMVQGDLEMAIRACNGFGGAYPGLWAASCRHDIASHGGQPRQAFDALERQLAQARDESAAARDWALVTLADIASRLGLPVAGRYWAFSLKQDPDDLYRRARFADWLLADGQLDEVVALTEGYEEMDTLAVLRAVALTRLDHPAQAPLIASLDARFAEAQWRGEFLHQWEFARYLLDVKGEAEAALAMAKANWLKQRAYPDRVLLMRAARAANDQEVLEKLQADIAMAVFMPVQLASLPEGQK